MKKQLVFIVNPKAGKGMIRSSLMDIVEIFNRSGYEVIIHITRGPKDAIELAREYGPRADLIVCSGGDGTLDEVVTGLMQASLDVRVGYIPAGSTNDFANSLFMPRDSIAVARNIVEGNTYKCDVGRFNDEVFVYVAAFGIFTDVSYGTDQDLKNMLGHAAYVLEGVKRLVDIRSYTMKVEEGGRTLEREFIFGMITNSRSVGGFKGITHDVDMNDGYFEVTLIEMPKNAFELQEILGGIMTGDFSSSLIHSFKSAKLTLSSESDVPWTLDGEFGGNHRTVEIENLHNALCLALTSTKKERLNLNGE